MRGIVFYTLLRLAVLAVVWLVIQAVTPMRGWLALAVAVIISGIISFVLLNRTRDEASVGLSGWFRKIDDRIERSRTAEDVDDDALAQGQAQGEQQPIDEGEQPGPSQDGDEIATESAAGDDAHGSDSERSREQR